MTDSADQRPKQSGRGRGFVLWLLMLAVVLTGAWLWQIASRKQTQDAHRAEMFQRTLESVRSACFPPKAGVESYCRDQALLLLEFPECDPACVALARKVRNEPTR